MKRIVIASIIFFAGFCAQAQVNPHAIGLRLGGNGDVNGAEISYQHGFGEANRLELDVGFKSNKKHRRMFLSGIYHWDWNITSGLNWYIGPGATLGFHSYEQSDDHLNIGLGGQVGLEFDFSKTSNAPILLSLDTRPMWDFMGDDENYSGFGWGAALGLRYVW